MNTTGRPGQFSRAARAGAIDIFVRDRADGTTICISVGADGNPVGGDLPSISPDGRYVTFRTSAGLVAEDTNGGGDLYVADGLAQGWWDAPGSSGLQANMSRVVEHGLAFDFGNSTAFGGVADQSPASANNAGIIPGLFGASGSLLVELFNLQGTDFII